MMRALLIIWAAWQGPVPWCHSHGTLANSSAGAQEFLRAHLSSHHATIDPCCDLHFCWHVHFDFPTPGSDSSNHDGNRPIRITHSDLTASSFNQLVRDAAINPLEISPAVTYGDLPITPPSLAGGQHFFDGFAPQLAPPLRFGVLRC